MRQHALYQAPHYQTCPDCGGILYRIEPPVEGWHHWCPHCQSLTMTRDERAKAAQNQHDGAIGHVVAVHYPMTVSSERR